MSWTNDRVMDKCRELFEMARRVAAARDASGARIESEPVLYVFGPKDGQFHVVDRAVMRMIGEGSVKEMLPMILASQSATHALWIAEAWIRSDAGKKEALMGICLGPRLEVHLRALLDEGSFGMPEEYRVPFEEPAAPAPKPKPKLITKP